MSGVAVRVRAPGRVNVIGEHTDYTGGFALPMAVQLETTVDVVRGGSEVSLWSGSEREPAVVRLDVEHPEELEPAWARYVGGVVVEMRPTEGISGTVQTTIPLRSGLSSSAALEVAVALALGFEGDVIALAQLCQRAEQRASGVPCGVMDQLASAAGVEGCLLLLDCSRLTVTPVALPDAVCLVGVHSGQERSLAGSEYAVRRAECEAAEKLIGPLRHATPRDVSTITDGTLQRRARHVVTENARVLEFAEALNTGDMAAAGALMVASHASLRDDFELSTPEVEAAVAELSDLDGVWGARLTGGGFGGVVVALVDATSPVLESIDGWRFRPSTGASVVDRNRR